MTRPTTDRLPLGWPLVSNVALVGPPEARMLLTALDPYRRRLRADGLRPNEAFSRLLDALEVLAKAQVGELPDSPRPAVRWIAVKVAAEVLGVTPQAVRDMAADGRLPSRREGRMVFVEEGAVRLLASYRTAA